ncbi:MAG: DUF4445 domain-containing protein [Gammaproteobacteria bacterium]|nr:DUF4445 domain-containing protein [Gammaproteobacteria bacterium]
MPTLLVQLEAEERRISFVFGQSLRHILDGADIGVRTGCRGTGACGLCLVRIEVGEVGEPTFAESIHLDNAQRAQGMRLACQVIPQHDLRITLLSPAPKSAWRRLDGQEAWCGKRCLVFPLRNLSPLVKGSYGVAVDLGTTHIRLSLHDLASGHWLAERWGLNPQVTVGSDIITRLMVASESPEQARIVSQQAVMAIGEALWDIAIREGIDLQQVVRLTLVGNTAMLALLSGQNVGRLLQPDHWVGAIDCAPDDTQAWAIAWGIHPQAVVEVLPPLAGFVGSDLLAGVITTCLTEHEAGSLLIDFGTNSEIALWDGQILWVASAAGGPAFEGSGIRCGLPAEPGAIYRVTWQNGVFDFTVLAGSEPRGFCGSGLVDLIAGLVRSGQLTRMGRFSPTIPSEGFGLIRGERDLVLTKRDVDMFQRAKAAIGVGIQVLLANAGMGCQDLRRICVSGAFGSSLDVPNAQEIGLLPRISPDRVELCGNTALTGCEEVLLSPVAARRLQHLKDRARIINLSQCSDFDTLFLENLYLQPL